jgi:short subunit dehydrogenase-like uncharacterized protein
MAVREFDIVLWGATGATGRRAADHLARRCAECGVSLAIGGRNRTKLEALRDGLAGGDGIAILVGDSLDAVFMDEMAARTRVVASTVGPFALYGSELVAACAANGTHYCDLTGEPQWMRADDRRAPGHGAPDRGPDRACLRPRFDPVRPWRAVPAGGGDGAPSALPCRRVANRVTRMKGGFSGGTAASFVNAMKLRETDPGLRPAVARSLRALPRRCVAAGPTGRTA